MVKIDKLLEKARNSASSLSFSDFQTLLSRSDWVLDHQRGSHQIWYSPGKYRLCVQNRKGKAKSYQVKQFLRQYEREGR